MVVTSATILRYLATSSIFSRYEYFILIKEVLRQRTVDDFNLMISFELFFMLPYHNCNTIFISELVGQEFPLSRDYDVPHHLYEFTVQSHAIHHQEYQVQEGTETN